ncbi:hypothetical protein ACVWXN_002138 [Bradyrhizobium sp. i1.4.4]|uniref:hypothetical protein n=1 Tax=unclassified Bradyrhizobium TaxID=2631580 RepID=UPI003396029D
MTYPVKITFGEMREMGVRGVLIYCRDYRCSNHTKANADHRRRQAARCQPKFVCTACGQRGA